MPGYQGPDHERLALRSFVRLLRAANYVSAKVHRALDEYDLTESQFGILEALLHLGPQQQSALASRILRSTGNVTLVIDKLEQRGLVRRERRPDDRRCIQVHLTPAGEALVAGIFPAHAARVAGAFEPLTEEEQRELVRLCRQLAKEES